MPFDGVFIHFLVQELKENLVGKRINKIVQPNMLDAVFIFIAPPSWKALESRLKNRGTESTEVIMERLTKAKGELMLASSYDYIVVNDEIENAVDKIIAIIRAEHAKCERALERYYELMEE